MVRLERVSKLYHGAEQVVFDGLDLRLGAGSFVFLCGPSGAGKTTLINLIMGVELPSTGRVMVAGRDMGALRPRAMAKVRRQLGVVFQDFRLLGRRSVFENVALALRVCGVGGAETARMVAQALRWVDLADKAMARADTLSGGEQQRVAIARALARRPKLILADEPTGNLDPQNTQRVLRLLQKAHAAGSTVLLATHDPSLPGRTPNASVAELRGGKLEMVR